MRAGRARQIRTAGLSKAVRTQKQLSQSQPMDSSDHSNGLECRVSILLGWLQSRFCS